jgi:16S rRNA (guanine966-N2)-methyltransferase
MKNSKKHSQSQASNGSIRIIAGRFRGKKLPVLDALGLRPTTDRVKETLFNWLMGYLTDSRCLDCFAGSGGLGFEALSRGAKHVTLVEMNPQAAQQIQRNLASLKSDATQQGWLVNSDCLHFLKQEPTAYNIVFVDPPFRQGLAAQVCQQLNQGWLAPQALVYLEVEAELEMSELPLDWQLLKQKIAGQVAYRLYQAG